MAKGKNEVTQAEFIRRAKAKGFNESQVKKMIVTGTIISCKVYKNVYINLSELEKLNK